MALLGQSVAATGREGTVMSDIIESSSTKNVASIAARRWHQITARKLKVEGIIESWNEHVQAEATETLRQTTEAARTTVTKNFKDWRRVVWSENEALLSKYVERTEVGTLRMKRSLKDGGSTGSPAVTDVGISAPMPSIVKATPQKAPEPDKKLSATEQAILVGSRRGIASLPEVVERLDAEDAEQIRRAVEESEAAEKRLHDFVLWACQKADTEVDLLKAKQGEAVWSDALTVETFGDHPLMRIILVRSSTAPLLGTHGPTVKHDFRANGKPVTVNHDQMFRQLDSQRLIRSRVVQSKSHEYYVKALQYQEGMYFKGYFVVDGEERHDLARYYICRKGKIESIDEAEYRLLENQAAARRSPI